MTRKLLRGIAITFITMAGLLIVQPAGASASKAPSSNVQSGPRHKQSRHSNSHTAPKHSHHHERSHSH